MSGTDRNSTMISRTCIFIVCTMCIPHLSAVSGMTEFVLLKKKPSGFTADTDWYDNCRSSVQAPDGLIDVDADGIPDSLFFRTRKPDMNKNDWKRFPWVEVAVRLSKNNSYLKVPAMISSGHSPLTLAECCGDCPNSLQLSKHECDSGITLGFTHGIPPEFEPDDSGGGYFVNSADAGNIRYYYPMQKWMELLFEKQSTKSKLPEVFGLRYEDIPMESRLHWLRQFYVKIAGEKAIIYTAVEIFEACRKK